ncbi:mycothiol transferase, partial [Micromonospora chersina]
MHRLLQQRLTRPESGGRSGGWGGRVFRVGDNAAQVRNNKVRGLSEDDARRSLVPSLTTLIGLVKHAAAV